MGTEIAEWFTQYRGLLYQMAYRITGTAGEAEDAVQDVFVQLARQDLHSIRNAKGYLIRMVANRSLNLLKSARRKREFYPGPWLPEPIADADDDEPAETAIRHEAVSYAIMAMLDALTPLERAVFVMKESLGFEYSEIAEALDKTEPNCRKILSRARRKMRVAGPVERRRRSEDAEAFFRLFLEASQKGDFRPLVSHLLEEVELITDGGGKVSCAFRPVVGADRVLAFFIGVGRKGAFRGEWTPVRIGGEPALVQKHGDRIVRVMILEWGDPAGSRLRRIFMVMNPDKLCRFGRHRSIEASGVHAG